MMLLRYAFGSANSVVFCIQKRLIFLLKTGMMHIKYQNQNRQNISGEVFLGLQLNTLSLIGSSVMYAIEFFHSRLSAATLGGGLLKDKWNAVRAKGPSMLSLTPKGQANSSMKLSVKRRIADLLLETENESIDIDELFKRFKGKCFKTKQPLVKSNRNSWAIDHILPSKWLYPLTKENAALLSKEANENKRDKWPSKFYTNSELIELAKITGANISLLTRQSPVINRNIDINKGVERYLQVREKSNLGKRVKEIKKVIRFYGLEDNLSKENRKFLGFTD